MPRYSRRPKSTGWIGDTRYEEDAPLIPGCDADEHVSTFTGLFDASGEEIWREPRPIGFGCDLD